MRAGLRDIDAETPPLFLTSHCRRVEELSKLTYAEQCLREALRRHSVLPTVTRSATCDVVVDGVTYAKGTTFMVGGESNFFCLPISSSVSNTTVTLCSGGRAYGRGVLASPLCLRPLTVP